MIPHGALCPSPQDLNKNKYMSLAFPQVGRRDVERCPAGHTGRAVRLCSPLPTPPPLPPSWETPDFSDCFYKPLVDIRTVSVDR